MSCILLVLLLLGFTACSDRVDSQDQTQPMESETIHEETMTIPNDTNMPTIHPGETAAQILFGYLRRGSYSLG